jgi:hypothetical protein
MADPIPGGASSQFRTKAALCRLLIDALQMAQNLANLHDTANIIRHLTYALNDTQAHIRLIESGMFPLDSVNVLLSGVDAHMEQAKRMYARRGRNGGQPDEAIIRQLYQNMLVRPGDFSDAQRESIRQLVNWLDDQGHEGGFAFGSAFGSAVIVNSTLAASVGEIVRICTN